MVRRGHRRIDTSRLFHVIITRSGTHTKMHDFDRAHDGLIGIGRQYCEANGRSAHLCHSYDQYHLLIQAPGDRFHIIMRSPKSLPSSWGIFSRWQLPYRSCYFIQGGLWWESVAAAVYQRCLFPSLQGKSRASAVCGLVAILYSRWSLHLYM